MNNNRGEMKQQTVFMGDFPLMTEKGTFVVNGTELVVVSQLVSSLGADFERTDKTNDKRTFTAKIYRSAAHGSNRNRQARPGRRALTVSEVVGQSLEGPRLDRRPNPNEFGQYHSMRATLEKAPLKPAKTPFWTSTASCAGRAAHSRGCPVPAGQPVLQRQARHLAKVGRYKINRKLGIDRSLGTRKLRSWTLKTSLP